MVLFIAITQILSGKSLRFVESVLCQPKTISFLARYMSELKTPRNPTDVLDSENSPGLYGHPLTGSPGFCYPGSASIHRSQGAPSISGSRSHRPNSVAAPKSCVLVVVVLKPPAFQRKSMEIGKVASGGTDRSCHGHCRLDFRNTAGRHSASRPVWPKSGTFLREWT